jgi:hypothetical protein
LKSPADKPIDPEIISPAEIEREEDCIAGSGLTTNGALVVDASPETLDITNRSGRWTGKSGALFDVTCRFPARSISWRAKKAGMAVQTASGIEADPDFMQDVREFVFLRKKRALEIIDKSLLQIVESGANENARVQAGRTLYDRFDERFKPKRETTHQVSFTDFIRQVYDAKRRAAGG